MGRESREVWAKRVSRWRGTQLTADEFAREIGVNANTFKSWTWKLSREGSRRTRALARPAFLEVTASPAASSDESEPSGRSGKSASFELVLGGQRLLRVPPAFDAEGLRRLLAVLEAR